MVLGMGFGSYVIYFVLVAGIVFSIVARKLTVRAALLGGLVGFSVFEGGGYTGIIMLTSFFILGSGATSIGLNKKQAIGAAEENKGGRTAGQVMANGGMAAILGAISWYRPEYARVVQIMMAGSLAAATADTLSSELGTILGRRFYSIITFKKDQRGQDGVISLGGTLIGITGAAIIACIYSIGHDWNINFLWIILAGIIGNIVDSLLGATLERRHLIGNNLVNFSNTLTGAAVCWLLFRLY
ncbi:DUF92 domain-containing protein [Mucilaginibacter sp. BJC16-A38]|uniref:DUF92 domain-containing protein n=1 Tax=Mucilaginibacter phenanthrenivorans TaxID=1234842 RepID=UPI002158748A|nr:DUF92 domain-containing protein [Mucilaginibacter phenanthrenivorans]MCR8560084.1 DUF92 domain-containing protein [Mucilaginibacter phenanthrenivorans]